MQKIYQNPLDEKSFSKKQSFYIFYIDLSYIILIYIIFSFILVSEILFLNAFYYEQSIKIFSFSQLLDLFLFFFLSFFIFFIFDHPESLLVEVDQSKLVALVTFLKKHIFWFSNFEPFL